MSPFSLNDIHSFRREILFTIFFFFLNEEEEEKNIRKLNVGVVILWGMGFFGTYIDIQYYCHQAYVKNADMFT